MRYPIVGYFWDNDYEIEELVNQYRSRHDNDSNEMSVEDLVDLTEED